MDTDHIREVGKDGHLTGTIPISVLWVCVASDFDVTITEVEIVKESQECRLSTATKEANRNGLPNKQQKQLSMEIKEVGIVDSQCVLPGHLFHP
jgi:hypothetical protein